MPEHPSILRLREVRRARVRYGRANLYIVRWGALTSGELDTAMCAFERGEGGAKEVCSAFVRSRIESHTASFDFECADLERLVDLVAAAATEPELQARTIDALAAELVELASAERDPVRRPRADLQKAMKSYFASSALGALHSVQTSLTKWKLGSIYKPQLPQLSSPLADSIAQLGAKVLGDVEPPSFHLGPSHARAPTWANAFEASGMVEQATLAMRQSITTASSHRHLEGHIASPGLASVARSKLLKFDVGDGVAPPWLGAFRSFEPAGTLAPGRRKSIAEIAAGFSPPALQNRIASLDIATQIGDLKLGASLIAGIVPKDFGIAALAQRQLGLLPRFPAWKDWADSFERSLPANWRELDPVEVDRVAGLMADVGLCLAWVPRAELIRALLAAPDHEARCQILVANTNEILADLEAVLLEVESEELAPIANAAEEAIRSARWRPWACPEPRRLRPRSRRPRLLRLWRLPTRPRTLHRRRSHQRRRFRRVLLLRNRSGLGDLHRQLQASGRRLQPQLHCPLCRRTPLQRRQPPRRSDAPCRTGT